MLYATGVVLSLAGAAPIAPRSLLPLPGVPSAAPAGESGPMDSGRVPAGPDGTATATDAAVTPDPSGSASPSASGTPTEADVSASPSRDGKRRHHAPKGHGPSPSGPAQGPTASAPPGGAEPPPDSPTSADPSAQAGQTAPPAQLGGADGASQ